MNLQEIIDNFEFIDGWEDRYRYLIELGQQLPAYDEAFKTDAYRVRGCVSQVWLKFENHQETGPDTVLSFTGASDAHIVSGLIALAIAAFSGQSAQSIVQLDFDNVIKTLGLGDHLSPQRSNGLGAMIQRIKQTAQQLCDHQPLT